MLFLNAKQPLATCREEDCTGCENASDLKCYFRLRDLALFLGLALPTLLLAAVGIYSRGIGYAALWLALIIGYFGGLEIRVMCSHCPHYAEPGRVLRCWANYGALKLWAFRPGPMSRTEKTLFSTGLAVVYVYPVPFFVLGRAWWLGLAYVVTLAGFVLGLRQWFCRRCMNFACPFNRVENPGRLAFLKKNPKLAEAWEASAEAGPWSEDGPLA